MNNNNSNSISSKTLTLSLDERRNIIVPGNTESTLKFCVDHFIDCATKAVSNHGYFAVALSGGSTPKAIYEKLSLPENHSRIDWKKLLVFWSDERNVPPDSTESNFKLAMDSGFSKLPIPKENIFRMKAEGDIEAEALAYEELIKTKIPNGTFDLVMLGLGEDGHTASLFPLTHGLHAEKRLVIANFIPAKNTWRMSLTFECINAATLATFYVLGKSKAEIVNTIFSHAYDPNLFPAQQVGTATHKALWVVDDAAAVNLIELLRK